MASLVRGHLKRIRSRWRKHPPRRPLIVLAVLRHDQWLPDMVGGNGVSTSTVCCWLQEVIELLLARAPRLDRALKTIAPDRRPPLRQPGMDTVREFDEPRGQCARRRVCAAR